MGSNLKNLLIFLKKKISSDRLIRNILVISGGTALAQIINIFSQPIITRIYTPDQYGILTVFMSLLLVFRIVTLRYEVAIPIPKKDEDAVHLLVISFLVMCFFSFVLTVSLLFRRHEILRLLNAEEMFRYWLFIPIGILIQGVYLVLQGWMYRKKNFKLIRQKLVLESISGNFLKILFGIFNLGSIGLVLAKIISIIIATTTLLTKFLKSNNNFLKIINRDKIKCNLIEYKSFPIYQTPSSLSLHLRNQLPIFFLAPLYGPQVAGFFGLANQIIKIPMNLVGNSVMNVFFAEVASLGKENPMEIKKLSDSLFKKLFLIGIFPMVILVLFAPFLFGLIFGEEWIEAGNFARILSFYVFANFIFSPVSRIYEVFGKQREKLLIDVASLFGLAIIFLIAGYFNFSVNILLYLYAATMFLVYFTTYILSNRILKQEMKKMKLRDKFCD